MSRIRTLCLLVAASALIFCAGDADAKSKSTGAKGASEPPPNLNASDKARTQPSLKWGNSKQQKLQNNSAQQSGAR